MNKENSLGQRLVELTENVRTSGVANAAAATAALEHVVETWDTRGPRRMDHSKILTAVALVAKDLKIHAHDAFERVRDLQTSIITDLFQLQRIFDES